MHGAPRVTLSGQTLLSELNAVLHFATTHHDYALPKDHYWQTDVVKDYGGVKPVMVNCAGMLSFVGGKLAWDGQAAAAAAVADAKHNEKHARETRTYMLPIPIRYTKNPQQNVEQSKKRSYL